MMKFDRRLDKIESKIAGSNAPAKMVPINIDAPGALEEEQKAMDAYFTEYGCLDGLTIVHTHVAKPLPLPAGFKRPNG